MPGRKTQAPFVISSENIGFSETSKKVLIISLNELILLGSKTVEDLPEQTFH